MNLRYALADHISAGLTDEEAAALEGISADCITRWRKANREFCGTIKRAEAQRLKARLARIERGEPGWQGTAWALERIYPKRFSRPDIQLAQQSMSAPIPLMSAPIPLVSSLSMRSCLNS
jgi:hypothetical protein